MSPSRHFVQQLHNLFQAQGRANDLTWAHERDGAEHSASWTATVLVNGVEYAKATGLRTKKEAREQAAQWAIEKVELRQMRVSGTKIVDGEGNEVLLRGAGLGGWMNQENFITGYPGREYQVRAALDKAIGAEKAKFYWDKFLTYFFTEADAKFFKSLGLNAIRVPFNYRHFEDDMNPRVLKPEGFKWLDRVVDICAKEGIYTILDLHAAAGGQNFDWHSDNGTHIASFWQHRDFWDRAIWLWEQIASHYKGNPWIAGFNPLNEPTDDQHTRLLDWYDIAIPRIQAIDSDHILFLDGNTFASDFSHFGDRYKNWKNTVYSVHDYSTYGFPRKTLYEGTPEQKQKLLETYNLKVEYMTERDLPVWNGEFGPVYARKRYDGEDSAKINESRYQVLKDQLEIYDAARISWSIWLYKDIGFQGMTYMSEKTPYYQLFANFLLKKHNLAVDSWGADDSHIQDVVQPFVDWMKTNVAEQHRALYPPTWSFERRIAKISRNILLAEYLVAEWAEHFIGKSEEELDALAASFKFENCEQREGLNQVLKEHNSAGM